MKERSGFLLIQKMFQNPPLEQEAVLGQKIANMHNEPVHQSWPDKEPNIKIRTRKDLESSLKRI